MPQIGLDIQPGGFPPGDDHSAYVSGPGAANSPPLMMQRKFIGETAGKIVALSDVFRVPNPVRSTSAEDVNARNRIEDSPDRVVLKLVLNSADASPNK